jgi:hypothetical protein
LAVREQRAQTALAAAWSRVAQPAATTDYDRATTAQVTQQPNPEEASPAVRAGLAAVAAQEQEAAALDAYAAGSGRYRGAMQAHDTAAAHQQAAIMVALIDGATTVARTGAQREADAFRLLDSERVADSHAPTSTTPMTGPTTGDVTTAQDDLPSALAAAGATPDEAKRILDDVHSLAPRSPESGSGLATPAGLSAGNASAPQPSDIDQLTATQHVARDLLASLQHATP